MARARWKTPLERFEGRTMRRSSEFLGLIVIVSCASSDQMPTVDSSRSSRRAAGVLQGLGESRPIATLTPWRFWERRTNSSAVTLQASDALRSSEVPQTPGSPVEVQCGEVSVHVTVRQDFLGNGQLINPADLTLGGCSSVGFHEPLGVVSFESELQGCGSTITTTEDSLVYSFVLTYSPSPIPNMPVVKTNDATVAIHCMYPRRLNVSGNALHPTWIPYDALEADEEDLDFSLKIMSDDWSSERSSNIYSLGDFMNFQASVGGEDHAPLRVFVDSCAAAAGSGENSSTVYTIIENAGCMIDSKLTRSGSRFMSRTQDDKLQFQIQAFRFKQDSSGQMYITCHLKATATSSPVDVMNKACSYVQETHSWASVSGDAHVCDCCQNICGSRTARSSEDSTFDGVATLGPIYVYEPAEDESRQEPSEDSGFSVQSVLLSSLVSAAGVLCVVVLGTMFFQRRRKR